MIPCVAFQGILGAFSHEASRALLPDFEPAAYPTFAAAFAAVENGACERAVIPVENSLAGPVPEVGPLLSASPLKVLAEAARPIEIALLVVAGAALPDLARVKSHPMALKQCRATLAKLGLEAVDAFDTAGAAAEVARAGDRSTAAAASVTAGALHGLVVLRRNIEDGDDNVTRFLVLGRG